MNLVNSYKDMNPSLYDLKVGDIVCNDNKKFYFQAAHLCGGICSQFELGTCGDVYALLKGLDEAWTIRCAIDIIDINGRPFVFDKEWYR